MGISPDPGFLYRSNTPALFWRLQLEPSPTPDQWGAAIRESETLLPEAARNPGGSVEGLLAGTLGEGQFGGDHWKLSPARLLYYQLKPVLPRLATRLMRKWHSSLATKDFRLNWPNEDRYAQFMWEAARRVLSITGRRDASYVHFWPWGHRWALVLTHDIETSAGQAFVRQVADLEESLGFRSSFNFVPERYRLDYELMHELQCRGFEIGVHGLQHDEKLFRSHADFVRRSSRINHYLKKFRAVGFRAPLTHRHPEWMQALDIEYDLSFFDTDPFEPIPGGTMCIWPFVLGRFIELPYTLVQDYTLTAVLGQNSPRIWLEKVDLIKRYCGMALINTHPDYLKTTNTWKIYKTFLNEMRNGAGYWHALPREVAAWWRARVERVPTRTLPGAVLGRVQVSGNELIVEPQSDSEGRRNESSSQMRSALP